MRYALVDANRVVTNIIEINPDQAAHFGALYVGDHPVGIGSAYPETELEPVPIAPELTTEEQIAVIQSENKLLKAQIQALGEQNDFHEELIVELANIVYA